jgi:hypothetical protein
VEGRIHVEHAEDEDDDLLMGLGVGVGGGMDAEDAGGMDAEDAAMLRRMHPSGVDDEELDGMVGHDDHIELSDGPLQIGHGARSMSLGEHAHDHEFLSFE